MSAFLHVRVHLIWSTAGREPQIASAWRDQLHAYFHGICENTGTKLIVAGGMPDHVHLLVSFDASHSIAEVVNLLKSNSSRWIHENHDRNFGWQTKYAAFSVSKSAEEQVCSYIRTQEQHHRQKSYREELMEFLRRHELKYDPVYLLE